MPRVLITGFERYGKEPINPTERIALELNGQVIGKALIYGLVLPVSYRSIKKMLPQVLADIDPDIVLSLGLSPQRTLVSIERIALNYVFSKIPDNDGIIIEHKKIIDNGPLALESTINVIEAANVMLKNGVPTTISYHAGTFLCNYVFYLILYYSRNHKRRVGFIHVPYTHRDVVFMLRNKVNKNPPSIHYDLLVNAIKKLILYLSEA